MHIPSMLPATFSDVEDHVFLLVAVGYDLSMFIGCFWDVEVFNYGKQFWKTSFNDVNDNNHPVPIIIICFTRHVP